MIEAALANVAAAAFDNRRWEAVLRDLMRLTGSTAANILGWENATVPSLLILNVDIARLGDWIELGGADVSNPIVGAVDKAPVYGSTPEHAVLSEDIRRRSPLWQDFYEANRIPHIHSGKAWSDGTRHVVLAAMQDRRRGPMSAEATRIYRRLLRATGAAVQTAEVLGKDRASLLSGAFEIMETPVFVLDGFGQVLSLSPPAERAVSTDFGLRLVQRKLRLADAGAQRRLDDAIGFLLGPARDRDAAASITVPLSEADAGAPSLRVTRTPSRDHSLAVDACLLVVIESGLRLNSLTPVELEVMRALASGAQGQEIARVRGVSLETIRTQSKAIYSKLGVSGRLDLILRLRGGVRPG